MSTPDRGPQYLPYVPYPTTGQPVALRPAVALPAVGQHQAGRLRPTTSLVAGLVGIFLGGNPAMLAVSWLLGPLAIVLGAYGLLLRAADQRLMSLLGILTGGAGMLFALASLLMARVVVLAT